MLAVDVCILVLTGLLAAWLAARNVQAPSIQSWLATQTVERYLAWLGVVALGLLLFFGRFQHYTPGGMPRVSGGCWPGCLLWP